MTKAQISTCGKDIIKVSSLTSLAILLLMNAVCMPGRFGLGTRPRQHSHTRSLRCRYISLLLGHNRLSRQPIHLLRHL